MSLQRPIDKQITTAQELFEWASKPSSLPNIAVKFSSKQHYLDAIRNWICDTVLLSQSQGHKNFTQSFRWITETYELKSILV